MLSVEPGARLFKLLVLVELMGVDPERDARVLVAELPGHEHDVLALCEQHRAEPMPELVPADPALAGRLEPRVVDRLRQATAGDVARLHRRARLGGEDEVVRPRVARGELRLAQHSGERRQEQDVPLRLLRLRVDANAVAPELLPHPDEPGAEVDVAPPEPAVEVHGDGPEGDRLVLRVEHALEPLERLREPGDEPLVGRLLCGLPTLLEALGPGAANLRGVLGGETRARRRRFSASVFASCALDVPYRCPSNSLLNRACVRAPAPLNSRVARTSRFCHANGSVALAFSTGRGWFGCRSVALPGEVDGGGRVECRGGHGPRPGWKD